MVKQARILKGTPTGRISAEVSHQITERVVQKIDIKPVVAASGINDYIPLWSDPTITWSDSGYRWSGDFKYQSTGRPGGKVMEDVPSSMLVPKEKPRGEVGRLV